MKHRIYALVFILGLTGCAQNYLATGLPRLEGQPVSQAVAYLGAPTQKQQTGGETLYTWVHNQSGSFYVPDTATYPVVTGGGAHPAIAFHEPSTPPVPDTYDWHCRLDITVKKGVIVHTDYQGNAGGCQTFSDKLKPLITKAEDK